MKRSLWFVAMGAAMLAAPPPGNAALVNLRATLSGANEVPPTGSPATGTVNAGLDTTAQTLSLQVVFSGLTAADNAAHIHCCLASPFLSGVNIPVATAVPSFAGFPLAVTSGTFNATFSLTDSSFYNPAFVTAQGGTVAGAEAALIAGLTAGETYFNIHTTQFPGGEIRGFLAPVPEPATLALLAAGLGAGGLSFRRKRS